MICTVPTISCFELNKRTPTHVIVLYKTILIYTHHHDNPTTDFSLLTLYTPHHFSTLHIASKILTSKAFYDPVTQLYIFCPLTTTFNDEESLPFIIPHEFIQPIKIPILEFIPITKYNHKIYNLIQNKNSH